MNGFNGLEGGEQFESELIPDLDRLFRLRRNEPTTWRPDAESVLVILVGYRYPVVPCFWGSNNNSWRASVTTVPVVVQLPDDRRHRGQFKRSVVDVGGGDIDWFKELGQKVETVPGGVQERFDAGNLMWAMLALGNMIASTEADLL